MAFLLQHFASVILSQPPLWLWATLAGLADGLL
jgi:hypothetical protein